MQFVRPGLRLRSTLPTSLPIARSPLCNTVADPNGLPLDAAGVTTPGTVSVSFVAAVLPNCQKERHHANRDGNGHRFPRQRLRGSINIPTQKRRRDSTLRPLTPSAFTARGIQPCATWGPTTPAQHSISFPTARGWVMFTTSSRLQFASTAHRAGDHSGRAADAQPVAARANALPL